MKGIKRFIVVLLMTFCLATLSGCVRFSTTVEVKMNGKADITILMAAIDQGGDAEDEDSSDEDLIKEYEDKGWDYEEYDEDGYKGYKVTKRNVDLEDIAKEMSDDADSELDMDTDKLKVEKKGFRYKISWDIADSDSDSETYSSGEEYSSYLTSSGGYAKFVVKLPVKPISSNAHKVSEDGKTLTWNLFDFEEGEKIELEFSLINWPLIIGICVGLLIIVAAVVVVLVVLRRKKGGQPPFPPQGNMYPPQGYAYPPQGNAYPPQGGYDQQGNMYPPQGGYDPQGNMYPPQGYAYPPQGNAYPPQGGYDQQANMYPPQGNAYPPQGGYQQTGDFNQQ